MSGWELCTSSVIYGPILPGCSASGEGIYTTMIFSQAIHSLTHPTHVMFNEMRFMNMHIREKKR